MATTFENGWPRLLGGCPVIFVTVGAQMPFDRLIGAVDKWAAMHDRSDIFAQIGPSDFLPRCIQVTRFIDPPEFRKCIDAASLVVGHAGMGSIITALELGRPIIVMPRRSDLGETRNDHQVATARRFLELGRVLVALNEKQLYGLLNQSESLSANERISREASAPLISALRNFIEHGVKS